MSEARWQKSYWLLSIILLAATLSMSGVQLHATDMLAGATAHSQDVVFETLLPRLSMSLLVGAALAFSGALAQYVLRNPLASPNTLGVASGAQCAIALCILFEPAWMEQREYVAMAGAICAAMIVFLLGGGKGSDPKKLILGGLVTSLYFSSLTTALVLTKSEGLSSLLVWSSGSMAQFGWEDVRFIFTRFCLVTILICLMLKPLQMLVLGDDACRALSLPVNTIRVTALMVVMFLTTITVAYVGIVGFIGLGAPALVNAIGASKLWTKLWKSTLLGALLLCTADLAVQCGVWLDIADVPTGAAIALLGAPLLLFLIRSQAGASFVPDTHEKHVRLDVASAKLRLGILAFALLLALACAAIVGHGPAGWTTDLVYELLPFRLPRIVAAASVGALLAIAGVLLQRVTGNEMASPEVLGISTGSAIGMLVSAWLIERSAIGDRIAAAALGAALVLVVLLRLSNSHSMRDRLILFGIAITGLFEALQTILLARIDPRGPSALGWLTGSTYAVAWTEASWIACFAVGVAVAVIPLRRWLDMLPLGDVVITSLGVPVPIVRGIIFMVALTATAASTAIVGPLSFVGLMAPHAAHAMGFNRAGENIAASILIGCAMLVLADWGGRVMLFPEQLPAGLMAALIGGPYIALMLIRRSRIDA